MDDRRYKQLLNIIDMSNKYLSHEDRDFRMLALFAGNKAREEILNAQTK